MGELDGSAIAAYATCSGSLEFQGKLIGSTDVALDRSGELQALAQADRVTRWEPQVCCSSPLRRCRQTASAVEAGIEVFEQLAETTDGFISTAGALLAQVLCPTAAEYIIAAHRSAEPGHSAMPTHLGKQPWLDLGLRLGEGTGAALAMPLLDAAERILTQVATFDEAHVSKEQP